MDGRLAQPSGTSQRWSLSARCGDAGLAGRRAGRLRSASSIPPESRVLGISGPAQVEVESRRLRPGGLACCPRMTGGQARSWSGAGAQLLDRGIDDVRLRLRLRLRTGVARRRHAEEGHGRLQVLRLCAEFDGGRGDLLGGRGILLRDLSSCWIAVLICEAPTSCSRQAAVISSTSSAVCGYRARAATASRRLRARPSPSRPTARRSRPRPTGCAPPACAPRSGHHAKPRPCSPARAASTAALSASRSVWRAISCTMLILAAIVCIPSTALPTASALASASLADRAAICSVVMALSAVCFTLAAISSIEAEASSVEAACSVEPCDSCSALAASCSEPADTFCAATATWVATPRSLATMFSRAMPSLSLSEWRRAPQPSDHPPRSSRRSGQ